jgi:hypothetical protein
MKKYKKQCLGCGCTKWVKISDYFNFNGDLMISFRCLNCNHIQTVKELDLKTEESK